MPIIVNPEDVKVTGEGEGWTEITIANSQTFGAPAMIARRWLLKPDATGPELVQQDVDQLLYVIRGNGTAVVDGVDMLLTEESVLWLEPGEQYQFVAGRDGLEILQGYAPGE
jgi:mannose-6-phosphate isomerase-like protein (cupin superfamily)